MENTPFIPLETTVYPPPERPVMDRDRMCRAVWTVLLSPRTDFAARTYETHFFVYRALDHYRGPVDFRAALPYVATLLTSLRLRGLLLCWPAPRAPAFMASAAAGGYGSMWAPSRLLWILRLLRGGQRREFEDGSGRTYWRSWYTTAEIATAASISLAEAASIMSALQGSGYVNRIGNRHNASRRTVGWELTLEYYGRCHPA